MVWVRHQIVLIVLTMGHTAIAQTSSDRASHRVTPANKPTIDARAPRGLLIARADDDASASEKSAATASLGSVETATASTTPAAEPTPPRAPPPPPSRGYYRVAPRAPDLTLKETDTPRQRQLKIEAQALREERDDISIGGAITFMVLGGIALVTGGTLVYLGVDSNIDRDNNDFIEPLFNEDTADDLILGGGIAAGVGAAMLIGGGISLGSFLSERRAVNLEFREKQRELFDIEADQAQLSLGPTGARLTVTF